MVDESNADADAGDDQVWLAQNGGNEGVFADGGTKPDEWKRGISTKDGGFGYVHGAEATGIGDLGEFREQISKDLNFNGVFDDYEDPRAFEDALIAQYGQGDPERAEQVRHIGKNIWSYANGGVDVNGNTNVAELQGLLFSLDPLIADASQSNTKHENKFTIPGSDVELNTGGDDYYGRATMLEARLLSSLLKEAPTKPADDSYLGNLDPGPEMTKWQGSTVQDDDVYSKTTFIMDVSASMYNDHELLADYFEEVDFGDTKMGGMRSAYDDISWHADGQDVSMGEGRGVMRELAQLSITRGNDHRKKPRAAQVSDMFADLGSGNEESSIAQAGKVLEEMQQNGDTVETTVGQQIVIATDEGDSAYQDLRQLRDQANEMQVMVKVLYCSADGMYEIPINAIDDETMAMLEDENGGLTIERRDDDARTASRMGGGGTHQELRWKRLADQMGIEEVEDIGDRESRRVPPTE